MTAHGSNLKPNSGFPLLRWRRSILLTVPSVNEDHKRLQTPDDFKLWQCITIFVSPTLQRKLVKFLVELVADFGRIPRVLGVASRICILQEIC